MRPRYQNFVTFVVSISMSDFRTYAIIRMAMGNHGWRILYESDDRLTINTGSVDRWKSVLNEHEVRHLELIGYDLMRHYGYELLNEPHNLLGVRAGELTEA